MFKIEGDPKIHVDIKKTVISMGVFVVITMTLSLLFVTTTHKHWIQLSSLLQSRYEYSAKVERPIGIDDYYIYGAGVVFTEQPNAEFRVNADILMQAEKSQYSERTAWNAGQLDLHSVAISQNIANVYLLTVGDKLYSKHLSTDILTEYTIAQIVPAVNYARIDHNEMAEGVIIMGYDRNYYESIVHETVVFTSNSVEELIESNKVYPLDIMYRENEIGKIVKQLILPVSIALLLSICISIIQSSFTTRLISWNFKRVLLIGYPNHILNTAWRRTFLFICFCVSAISFLLCLIGSFMIFGDTVTIALLFLVLAAQAAVCVVMCRYFRLRVERS